MIVQFRLNSKVYLGFIISGLLSVGIATQSCKPKSTSGLSAIVSRDGKNAIGLLPMRQHYENSVPLAPGVASMVEDAIRLTYGAAKCVGPDAAAIFNTLEDISKQSTTALRHDGTKILIPIAAINLGNSLSESQSRFEMVNSKYFQADSGGHKSIDPKTCWVMGDDTLSAGSFVRIMADQTVEFKAKQIIWLAARGRWTGGNSAGFAGAFYTFLRESLGATPMKGEDTTKRIQYVDTKFNPCVDKKLTDPFTCDANGNYEVVGNFEAELTKLLALVKKYNSEYLSALDKGDGQAKDAARGLRVSASVVTTIAASQILEAKVGSGTEKSPAPSAGQSDKIHPSIAVMLGYGADIQEMFKVNLGTKPGDVIDSENPRSISVSPSGASSAGTTTKAKATVSDQGFSLADTPKPTTNQSAASANTTNSQPPAKSQPITFGSITPTATKQVQGSDNGWARGTGADVNNFVGKPDSDGNVWKSVAEKNSGGGWSYRNSQYDKSGSPVQEKMLFTQTEGVGPGVKNGFTEYKIKTGEAVGKDDYNKFEGQSGRLFSQEEGKDGGSWLNFSKFNDADNKKYTPEQPINFGVKGKEGTGTASVVPYRFHDGENPENNPRLLLKDTGNNFAWVTPPQAEKEVVPGPSGSPVKMAPLSEERFKDFMNAGTTRDKTVVAEGQKRKAATLEADSMQADGARLKEERELQGRISAAPIGEKTAGPDKDLLVELQKEQDISDRNNKKLEEMRKNGGTPSRVDIDKAKLELAEQRLSVAKAKADTFARNNVPKPGATFTEPQKNVLKEINLEKKENEQLVAILKTGNSTQLEQNAQQQKIEERKLQTAKLERESFHGINGNRFNDRGDTYTPKQIADLENLHKKVYQREQAIKSLKQQQALLEGNYTQAEAIPMAVNSR